MKLEIAVLWENKNWDTHQIDVPFALDDSSECWEECETYCKWDVYTIPQFSRAVRIIPWDIVE